MYQSKRYRSTYENDPRENAAQTLQYQRNTHMQYIYIYIYTFGLRMSDIIVINFTLQPLHVVNITPGLITVKSLIKDPP